MIIPDSAGLPGALAAGAAGICALKAGTELIIGWGCWLRREGFTSRFVTAVDRNDQGTMLAGIPGPLPLPSPEQLAEMGACGAVGVARQRRTPGDFVVLCYAES